MTDIFTKEKRSDIMSKVRREGTKPEMIARKHLFSNGIRYRVNVKDLPGTPDIAIKKYKIAIFINGCFWHGHDCPRIKPPKTEWWIAKINKNKERDRTNRKMLENLNWTVIIIWECELNTKKRHKTLNNLELSIRKRMNT